MIGRVTVQLGHTANGSGAIAIPPLNTALAVTVPNRAEVLLNPARRWLSALLGATTH
jgi:hypothetical protein